MGAQGWFTGDDKLSLSELQGITRVGLPRCFVGSKDALDRAVEHSCALLFKTGVRMIDYVDFLRILLSEPWREFLPTEARLGFPVLVANLMAQADRRPE